MSRSHKLIIGRIIEFISKNIRKDALILDAGCGEGHLLKLLYKKGYNNLWGIDLFTKPLEMPIKFYKQDLNRKTIFEDNFFDLIVASEVIEHLENPWSFINEMYRILKPGGYLIITTPNVDSIQSRILFLLRGRFVHFGGGNLSYERNKPINDIHRTPIFHFLFLEMIFNKFKIIRYFSDGFLFKIWNKEIFFGNNPIIGSSKVYILKKIK